MFTIALAVGTSCRWGEGEGKREERGYGGVDLS